MTIYLQVNNMNIFQTSITTVFIYLVVEKFFSFLKNRPPRHPFTTRSIWTCTIFQEHLKTSVKMMSARLAFCCAWFNNCWNKNLCDANNEISKGNIYIYIYIPYIDILCNKYIPMVHYHYTTCLKEKKHPVFLEPRRGPPCHQLKFRTLVKGGSQGQKVLTCLTTFLPNTWIWCRFWLVVFGSFCW